MKSVAVRGKMASAGSRSLAQDGHMQDKRNVVFIIGFPRSGTKLLRAILCNHRSIFITHELLFLPYLIEKWAAYGDVSQFSKFQWMYDDVMRTYYFVEKRNRGARIIGAEEWYERCRAFDILGVLLPIIQYETSAPELPGIWLGDKSPNYTTHVSLIKKAIPEAKFIHIIRDVRDTALSARKVWNKNIYRFVQRWADDIRELQKILRQMPDADRIEVRYEDLVRHSEMTLTRILSFLGLDYDPAMLKLQKPSENFGDARDRVAVVSSNTEKYKNSLRAMEIRRLESICWDVLRHYGYQTGEYPALKRIPHWKMSWFMCCDVVNRLVFDYKQGHSIGFIMKSIISLNRTRV
jgi:hypothetical protein